ncbi:hypothetical protein SO802_010147 [Lithocarpus litseifolius]|uniref:Uncharacterized protein n=1 Tax=Lithocarpus litseifolius TaxID=425828 RepID=A0AAW2DHB1_9ROSI
MASMVDFDIPKTKTSSPSSSPSLSSSSSPSSSSSSTSSTSYVSTPEELSEMVELPSLGTSYELSNDFVFIDLVDGWVYPPPWYHNHNHSQSSSIDECSGYFRNQITETVIPSSFKALLWEY